MHELRTSNVDAILEAPYIGPVNANDPNVLDDYPLPETPASIKAEVLAEAADVYDLVLTEKDLAAVANGELLNVFAQVEDEVRDAVALTRVEIAESNARIQQQTAAMRETAVAAALDSLHAEAEVLGRKVDALRSTGERERAKLAEGVQQRHSRYSHRLCHVRLGRSDSPLRRSG